MRSTCTQNNIRAAVVPCIGWSSVIRIPGYPNPGSAYCAATFLGDQFT